MGRPARRWFGWPIWAVWLLVGLAAITGSAGPVAVLAELGAVGIALWWAGVLLVDLVRGGRSRAAQEGRSDEAGDEAPVHEEPVDEEHPAGA